jgi:hypothetical protein
MLILPSCIEVHHKVDPIHMVVDVNIRVERELDQFFAFEEQPKPPATQPASQQTNATDNNSNVNGGAQ